MHRIRREGGDTHATERPTKPVFLVAVAEVVVGLVVYFFMDDSNDLGFWLTFGGGALMSAGAAPKGF